MSYTVGIIIVSDRSYTGERKDECVDAIESAFDERFNMTESVIVNDNPEMIEDALVNFISKDYNIIITSGGTGCAARDNTPEATIKLLEKPTPGIDEAIRRYSQTKSAYAIYSRAVSGIVNKSLIINLPGSPRAVKEIVEFLITTIEHPLRLIANQVEDCQKELNNENLR
jgi:molybdopterin adenylyltransferase